MRIALGGLAVWAATAAAPRFAQARSESVEVLHEGTLQRPADDALARGSPLVSEPLPLMRAEKRPAGEKAEEDQGEDDAIDYHFMEQDLERRKEDHARRKSYKEAAAAAAAKRNAKAAAKGKHHKKRQKHRKAKVHVEDDREKADQKAPKPKRRKSVPLKVKEVEEADEEATPRRKSVPARQATTTEPPYERDIGSDEYADEAPDERELVRSSQDPDDQEGSDEVDDDSSEDDSDSDDTGEIQDSDHTASDSTGDEEAEDGEAGDGQAYDDDDSPDEDSLAQRSSKRRQAAVAPHGPTQLRDEGSEQTDSQLLEMGEASKELRNAMHFLPALGINDPNDIAYRAMDMIMGIASIIPEDYPYVCICGDTGVCVENIPPASATDCSMRIGQKSGTTRTASTGITVALLLVSFVNVYI